MNFTDDNNTNGNDEVPDIPPPLNGSNGNSGANERPEIPPPREKRSPLVKGTCKAIGTTAGSNAGGKSQCSSNPFAKSVKSTIAIITVSASIIGAFSTIAGFATSVSPLAKPQPVFATTSGMSLADLDKMDGPLAAIGLNGRPFGQCPLKSTTMDAKLSGYVARVNVTQVFTNPFPEKIEAIYNLPLSDDSAVDDMTIKVGDRTIKGQIKTREAARATYEHAKQIGRATALLDQERTNVFTQHVANIEPGKSIVVKVSYVELLKFEDGRYTFTMPTTMGARFHPGSSADGTNGNKSDMPRAAFVGTSLPGQTAHQNLAINVDVDGALPIKNVSSKTFPIMVDKLNASHSTVTLRRSGSLPNKDFVLSYELDKPEALKSGYLAYRDPNAKDKDGYATFMLLPPAKVTGATAAPKDMIFLVDCSGSQSGPPLEKAKETMNYIVDHMNANDTFQILAFNDAVATCSDQPLKAGLLEKLKAHEFINRLQAQGGTWMGPAVQRVLHTAKTNSDDIHRLRIVTFMTDGQVGNDIEIMDMVKKERGDSRWFVFGTGNGVNHALIDNVAKLGGGEADYVNLASSADEVGKKFYSRISSPALTDVKLQAEGIKLYDVLPAAVSDVWANKPLYFTARYKDAAKGKVVLTGFAQGRPYKQTLDVVLPASDTANSAIEKIWARQKIEALTEQDLQGLDNNSFQPELKKAVTQIALDHRLMSDFTSFVAVEESAPSGGPLRTVGVPNMTPEGTENSPTEVQSTAPLQQVQLMQPVPQVQQAQSILPVQQYSSGAPSYSYYGGGSTVMQDGTVLQGATNGTIGPQGSDATIIEGVNTAGTVRVNNLANLEALLNILANAGEILGIAWGGTSIVIGIRQMARRKDAGLSRVAVGALIVLIGLALPGSINWLVASLRDLNVFS